MTSQPAASGDDAARGPAICRRPGCDRPLPARGRGRNRVFCSDDCAQRYHNDARIPAPAAGTLTGDQDPLAAPGALTRQIAVLVRAAREQAASLDPAHVRAQVAEAEAARRRAEAAAVTAQAQAAEAREETAALAGALAAAREHAAAAQDAAQHQADEAMAAAAALEQLRAGTAAQVTVIQARAGEQAAAARADAEPSAREADEPPAAFGFRVGGCGCFSSTLYRFPPQPLCGWLKTFVPGGVVPRAQVDKEPRRWAHLALDRMLEIV